jgi:bacterioferritin-associated ferredoxin
MMVCHCVGVNDAAIREALSRHRVSSVEGVTDICGAGSRCGGCRPTICALVDRHVGGGSADVALSATRRDRRPWLRSREAFAVAG